MTPKALVLIVLGCSFMAAGTASAQSRPTTEVAAQTTMLHLNDSGTTNAGIGGRFLFDLSRWVALDGEASFFPKDNFELAPITSEPTLRVVYHRRRAEVLAGIRSGVRGDRFGAFAKVRPGFSRLTDRGIDCVGEMCALALFARPEYKTEFALDLGGIFEFYPTRRTVARVDLGDVMIRHRSSAPPCDDCTSHNFTSQLGFGFRF
jgi:hypothetical protein